MISIKGYKYLTEQGAIGAREACDTFYNIPVSPDDTTQNWVEYRYASLNTPPFWFIVFTESLSPVLGEPTVFDIITPPLPR
jgi:hypothetical protein